MNSKHKHQIWPNISPAFKDLFPTKLFTDSNYVLPIPSCLLKYWRFTKNSKLQTRYIMQNCFSSSAYGIVAWAPNSSNPISLFYHAWSLLQSVLSLAIITVSAVSHVFFSLIPFTTNCVHKMSTICNFSELMFSTRRQLSTSYALSL